MSDSIKQNLSVYDAQADVVAPSYDTFLTADIAPAFVKTLSAYPQKGDLWALDIGCGSGRDARWMAEQGFNVVAVDGSAGMLAHARATQSHERIEYIQDTVPALRTVSSRGRRFDIVLMNGFLFHLEATERQELYATLKTLVREEAYIYITLRHGPTPEGRRLFPVHPEELARFADDNDIAFAHLGQNKDFLKREGVWWDHVALTVRPSPRTTGGDT